MQKWEYLHLTKPKRLKSSLTVYAPQEVERYQHVVERSQPPPPWGGCYKESA